MRNEVNKYGSIITSAIKLGQLNKQSNTIDDLVFYGYYEYTGTRKFWKKIKMATKIRLDEHFRRRKH